MKAIIQSGYGASGVYSLQDVPRPEIKDDDVLVRVRAASLHADVWHVMRGLPYVMRIMGSGLLRPRNPIPGTDVSGIVEATGVRVTRFKPGDEVFGECVRGHPWQNGGAFAEFVAVREKALALKPAHLSFAEAAAAPTSGLIVLDNLRGCRVRAGDEVLVNGAGGGVGLIALQILKSHGATVTAVDHAAKLPLLRQLGADLVIDYARDDFTQGDQRYEVIFDVVGNRPFAQCRRVLTRKGTYVLIGHDQYGRDGRRVLGAIPRFIQLMMVSPFVSQGIGFSRTKLTESPLVTLTTLLESGKLRPYVGEMFPLGRIADAMHAMEAGRVTGKIVMTL